MGRVFVFGMLGVIVIGLIAGGILIIVPSARLAFRRGNRKDSQGEK